MKPHFTAHNILLDDGTYTNSSINDIKANVWNDAATRTLDLVFPDKKNKTLIDLGCLEGGHSVRFARMGFDVLGLEVRKQNYDCCMYAKERVNLPNLNFVQDNVLNIEKYGKFDVVFCCGLFYHLDNPKQMLEKLSKQTKKMLILQTHFSLTGSDVNEGIPGEWWQEFGTKESHQNDKESSRWSSYHNARSFWIKKEVLIGLIKDNGFDIVYEQFDAFPNVSSFLQQDYYRETRGTFIGIRT